ncbi:Hypothetical predicted protein [Pelobates cultripes]|nr:Hypothetical predicted protein [Pelobates cultripes]
MEKVNQEMMSKEKVQKHRRSKAKNVDTNCENKQIVERKSVSGQKSSSLLSQYNKEVLLQGPRKEEGIIKQAEEKEFTGKELRIHKDLSGLNIEKSAKDLQRCLASITRYRQRVKDEVENSVRNIKSTFAELYKSIIEREVQLMLELERVKEEALENLMTRQITAEELRRTSELSSHKTDSEISELRAQIKHFVSERKYDEELTKSARVTFDAEQLMKQIILCGEISHPKNSYSPRTPNSTVSSSEVQNITAAKPKVHTPRMKKPLKNYRHKIITSDKDHVQCIEGAETGSDNLETPHASPDYSRWSNKQVVAGHTYWRKCLPKMTGFHGSTKTSKSDDGSFHDFHPRSRCEETRRQKNTFNSRNRRATHNKECPSVQNKNLEHTEYSQDSRRKETETVLVKGSTGHIT